VQRNVNCEFVFSKWQTAADSQSIRDAVYCYWLS